MSPDPSPMRLCLADERRAELAGRVREFFEREFDEPMSQFRAERLVEFFVRELGPPVYNQAVRDARAFLSEKLEDMEGEVFEPDPPRTAVD